MIVGIGVDSVSISRVQKAMEREHFSRRIFTEKELAQMDAKKRRAASDFAGKEAVVKVFGTGFEGVEPGEIAILRDERGAPYIELLGKARELAEQMGIEQWQISITNTQDVATAFAVGLGKNNECS